jgi:hypothetical protein
VIVATTMFFPIERAIWIALRYATGAAERAGEALGHLAGDSLQDFGFLVIVGWTSAFPLWVLNALFLSFLARRQTRSWLVAALSGMCVGLVWFLWPCGTLVVHGYATAGIYSDCLPRIPGINGGTAGCLTGLLYFWIWQGGKDQKQARRSAMP